MGAEWEEEVNRRRDRGYVPPDPFRVLQFLAILAVLLVAACVIGDELLGGR
jgi:hypothetical protein